MGIHCSIRVCTPIPAETCLETGEKRLGRLTVEWQRARSMLMWPVGCNVGELYADGREVGEARTLAARTAVKEESKYLFFLDWDTIPPQDALVRLVAHLENNPCSDIAAGMYCSRTNPPWPLLWREWGQGVSWDWTLGEILTRNVVGIPMGCTLIRVDLFKRLPDNPADQWFNTINELRYNEFDLVLTRETEDLNFCLKFQDELRDKIIVDTGIQCQHIDPATGRIYSLPESSLPVRRAKAVVSGMASVLHVGCGMTPLPDGMFPPDKWREVRLDIDPAVKPDVLASMTDMRRVFDDTHDAIYSNHNLEHLYSHEVLWALKEFFRVLKPGRKLFLNVPDIEEVAQSIVNGVFDTPIYDSHAGPICPIDVLYGYRKFVSAGNKFQQHKTGFTAQYLEKLLIEAGFVDVKVERQIGHWGLAAEATKKG